MAVAPDKTRVQVTFFKEDVEKAKEIADSLGMTLSGYISMLLHSTNQQNPEKVFQSVMETLAKAYFTT